MSFNGVPEEFVQRFTKAQKDLVTSLSRGVVVGIGTSDEVSCPNCLYDTVSNSSGAIFSGITEPVVIFVDTPYQKTIIPKSFRQQCPVCRGVGKFTIPLEMTLMMHVTWEVGATDTQVVSPGGDGFQHQVLLKTDSKNYSYMTQADYFIVDGTKVKPISPVLIRGTKYRDGIAEVLCATTEGV